MLDYKTVLLRSGSGFFRIFQIDLIRQIAPHQKITHNMMGFYDKTDYYKLAEKLDFASNDQYPTGYYIDPPGEKPYQVAACMDLIRSLKKQNFWMMEMESGPTGGAIIGGKSETRTKQAVDGAECCSWSEYGCLLPLAYLPVWNRTVLAWNTAA